MPSQLVTSQITSTQSPWPHVPPLPFLNDGVTTSQQLPPCPLCIDEDCTHYVVVLNSTTYLEQPPILEWFVFGCGSMNGYQKYM